MYIQKAEITNIKSIEHFEIEFPNPAGWHVLIGDNGSGKSTIVRAIALLSIKAERFGLRQDFKNWINYKSNFGKILLSKNNTVIDLHFLKSDEWFSKYPNKIDNKGNVVSLNLIDGNFVNKDFLTQLNNLKYLTSLDFSYSNLSGANLKMDLPNLTSLDFSYSNLSSANLKMDLPSLTFLDLNNTNLLNANVKIDFSNLKDLEIFREMRGLTHLDLSGNNLSNVDFLKDLTNLTSLNLSHNNLSNVDFLKDLVNLTSLDLSYNNLSNIVFLKDLTNLTYLGLIATNSKDVNFIRELMNLTSLDLMENDISDISFLKDLPNLTCISLAGNKKIEALIPEEILLDIRNPKRIIEFVEGKKTNKKKSGEYLSDGENSETELNFSCAFGPYRRFEGGSAEWDEVYNSPSLSNLAAHLSIFDESVALTEPIKWLKDLNYKTLEKNKESKQILENLKKLINSEDFLPHNSKLEKVSSDGVFFKDANETTIAVNQLSDGYRSILSLTFELIRQLVRVYGSEKVFKNIEKGEMFIDLPGVVLIDEIDAHLHPTWQTRIGQWFLKYFPKLQFIVTTHSPLVCRAAEKGSIWRLAAPGSDEKSGEVTGIDRDRLIYGNVLDAYGTEVFGANVSISQDSNEMLNRLSELNVKSMMGVINKKEEKELQELRTKFPTENKLKK